MATERTVVLGVASLELLALLAGIAILVLFLYLFYSATYRAFEAVGFTKQQATTLLLGAFILSAINVPLFPYNGWTVAINLGGAALPLVVSAWLLHGKPSLAREALVGVTMVAFVTYLVTDVIIVDGQAVGIGAPLYLAVLPPMVAGSLAVVAHWRREAYSAPLAFVSGALGSLIGADVFRLQEFLSHPPPEPGAFASIGGAGVQDMVFLSAILAVALDIFFFRRFQSEEQHDALPWEEAEVFTPSTPPEVIANWQPTALRRPRKPQGPAKEARRPAPSRETPRESPPQRPPQGFGGFGR